MNTQLAIQSNASDQAEPPRAPGAPGVPGVPRIIERYHIEHTTRYQYSAPVALDQLVMRLQPRTDAAQRLIEFTINVSPQPNRHTYCLDLHGNLRHWFWFQQEHTSLTLVTRCVVDCHSDNAFDFIIVDPGVERLPAVYAQPVGDASEHYRQRQDPHPAIDDLARRFIKLADHKTLPFLWELTKWLNTNIRFTHRPAGDPWPARQTLDAGEGSCRDSTVLFIDACRAAGLAARFVSGYAWDAIDPDRRELHAWAEVYIPGAGWRGYDSTIGMAVSNRHVAVAASPTPAYAAPAWGTFTGPPVHATLDYDIQMTRQTRPCPPTAQNVTYHWR